MQTARSTEQIARHIGEVRSATGASVTAVARIEQMIGEVSAIAEATAAGMRQQDAATAEIARNVAETAGAANAVVDVKVFTRKGQEKDLRTQQIEREQIAKWEKDLEDEERIIRAEAKKKIVAPAEEQGTGRAARRRQGQGAPAQGQEAHPEHAGGGALPPLQAGHREQQAKSAWKPRCWTSWTRPKASCGSCATSSTSASTAWSRATSSCPACSRPSSATWP